MTVKLLRAFDGFPAGASYDAATDVELALVNGGSAVWDTKSTAPGGGPGDAIGIAMAETTFSALVAAAGLVNGVVYRVGTPEVWYRATGVNSYALASWGDSIDVSVPAATGNLLEV